MENENNNPVVSKNEESVKLSDEQKQEANDIANNIDLNVEDDELIHFGVSVQEKISNSADDILNTIKENQENKIQNDVKSLMKNINYVDADGKNRNFFQKARDKTLDVVPWGHKLHNKGKEIYNRFNSVSHKIEEISNSLIKNKQSLMRDNNSLDQLIEDNINYLKDAKVNIEALNIKLAELNDTIIPQKEKELAEYPNDEILQEEINDLENKRQILYKKLDDLNTAKIIAQQGIAEIKTIQRNNQIQIRNITNAITNTIPVWKNQITITIASNNQRKSIDALKSINQGANETLKKTSERIKQNSAEIAEENKHNAFNKEDIEKANQNIIETLQQMKSINEDNIEKIEQRQRDFNKLQNDIASAITDQSQRLNTKQSSNKKKLNVSDRPENNE